MGPMPNEPTSTSKQLLCEGYDEAFVPEVVYVRQGNKVCFLRGAASQLTEAVGDGVQLVESVNNMELTERDIGGKRVAVVKDGKWIVEGPYQRSDVKNANGRTYPRKIWERLLKPGGETQKGVQERAMYGQNEHPADGRCDLNKASILTTKLVLREDGVVWGRSELLDTEPGVHLQSLTAAGVKWGVSSRGNGSVSASGVVNETDFSLVTFDAVSKPSTPGAYPKPVSIKDATGQGVESSTSGTTETVAERTSADRPVPESPISSPVCLTEAAKRCVERAHALSERVGDSPDLASALCEQLGVIASLCEADAIPVDAAAEAIKPLQARLLDVIAAVRRNEADREAAAVDGAIDESVEADAERRNHAFRRVVAGFQQRLNDAVAETSALREQLQAQSAAQRDVERRLREALVQRNTAVAHCERLQEEVSSLTNRLDAAKEMIADQSAADVDSPVDEAVRQLVEKHPQLSPHATTLCECRDVDHAVRVASALLAANPPVADRTASRVSPALPQGSVVSESDVAPPRAPTSTSRGAALAAGAVKRMSTAQA
jgi:hypothetical protein